MEDLEERVTELEGELEALQTRDARWHWIFVVFLACDFITSLGRLLSNP